MFYSLSSHFRNQPSFAHEICSLYIESPLYFPLISPGPGLDCPVRETFMVTWQTMGFPAGQQGALPPGWLRSWALAFHSFRISLSGALVFLWWHTSKHLPWRLPQKLQQVSGLSQLDTDMPGMPIFGNDTATSTHTWSWQTIKCLTGEGNVLEAHVRRTQFSQIRFKHPLCTLPHSSAPFQSGQEERQRREGLRSNTHSSAWRRDLTRHVRLGWTYIH